MQSQEGVFNKFMLTTRVVFLPNLFRFSCCCYFFYYKNHNEGLLKLPTFKASEVFKVAGTGFQYLSSTNTVMDYYL